MWRKDPTHRLRLKHALQSWPILHRSLSSQPPPYFFIFLLFFFFFVTDTTLRNRYLSASPHPDLGSSLDQCLKTWKQLCSAILREQDFADSLLLPFESSITGDSAKALQTSLRSVVLFCCFELQCDSLCSLSLTNSALEFLCGLLAITIEGTSATALSEALSSKPLTAKKKWSVYFPLGLVVHFGL